MEIAADGHDEALPVVHQRQLGADGDVAQPGGAESRGGDPVMSRHVRDEREARQHRPLDLQHRGVAVGLVPQGHRDVGPELPLQVRVLHPEGVQEVWAGPARVHLSRVLVLLLLGAEGRRAEGEGRPGDQEVSPHIISTRWGERKRITWAIGLRARRRRLWRDGRAGGADGVGRTVRSHQVVPRDGEGEWGVRRGRSGNAGPRGRSVHQAGVTAAVVFRRGAVRAVLARGHRARAERRRWRARGAGHQAGHARRPDQRADHQSGAGQATDRRMTATRHSVSLHGFRRPSRAGERAGPQG
jgi:hypothetical protein